MAKQTTRQRRTAGRVMHEFKHGELMSGAEGRGGEVKSREQAIAIALKESGASRYESPRDNARNERRSERKEAQGRTGQQEREGKARVGAAGRSESTAALRRDLTRPELYAKAQRRNIAGRSRMTKAELQAALGL